MFITKPEFSSGQFPQRAWTKFLIKVEWKVQINDK